MLYRLAWLICRYYLLLVRRMKIYGIENVPISGGLVLVSNHISYWDPIIIGCAMPQNRQIFFMAKYELFKIPLLGPVIAKLGAFPVKRGGADRSAIRTALAHLGKNRIVGIFPEGTRSKKEEVLDPHMGAAMLSTRASVPVLPVAVTGSRGFWGKVRIIIGETIFFEPDPAGKKAGKKDLELISNEIMLRITGLMEIKKR